MNNLGSYQNTMKERILDTRHETLMVMLYDGMVTRVKQAKERFESKQDVKAKESVIQTMRIADALMDNINFDEGGDTAHMLEKLYFYIITELGEANRGKEPITHLNQALKVLEILLDAWKQLESKVCNAV